MRRIKLFEEFNAASAPNRPITDPDRELFKSLVKTFTADEPHLDPEDEASLIAICSKMDLEPSDVHRDFLVPRFYPESRPQRYEDIEESIISHRTEIFLSKLISAYIKKFGHKDDDAIKELCTKLGEDFDKLKMNHY